MSKFAELRDKRLPVALAKISLLGNLHRYKPTDEDRREVVGTLQAAVDGLRAAYRLPEVRHTTEPRGGRPTPPPAPPRPASIPPGTAEGGASFENEVRWALDAINRGDTELAAARLKRCLS